MDGGEGKARWCGGMEDGEIQGYLIEDVGQRLNMLMAPTEKKLKFKEKKTMLEEKKVEIATASEDAKMLT